MGTKSIRAVALFFTLLVFRTPLPAQPGFRQLAIIGTPALTVDPTCPNCDGGVLDIYLRNDNSGPVPLLLTTSSLMDKTNKIPVSGNLTLQPLDPCTKNSFSAARLEHGQILLLRVTVSNLLQEGQWQAELYNRGVDLGSFTVIRSHLPFNVTLITAKPDTPEITFTRDSPTALTLSNADQVSYPVSVRLIVKGHASELKEVTVPPGNSTTFSLSEPEEWFDQPWFGHFKDETDDGQLVLSLRAPPCPSDQCASKTSSAKPTEAACFAGAEQESGRSNQSASEDPPQSASGNSAPAAIPGATNNATANGTGALATDTPTKIIKVTVHLVYDSRGKQFWWISALLLAGALSSFFLSAYVPNQLQRIKLQKQLDQLANRVRDLPMTLASQLRVSVGLEEKRLEELLHSAWGFAPGFSSVVDEVNTSIAVLDKRLPLVQQLGALRQRFEHQRSKLPFPTPMNKLSDGFETCVEVLRKIEFSDDDKAAAKKVLQDMTTKLDNLEDIALLNKQEPDLVRQICERADKLPEELEPKVSESARVLYRHMREGVRQIKHEAKKPAAAAKEIPAPVSPAPDAAQSVVGGYPLDGIPDVDRLTVKMEMLRESSRLLIAQQDYQSTAGSDSKAREILNAMTEACQDLAKLLESQNPEEFDAAARLLQQIREHIFAEDVENEIAPTVSKGNDADVDKENKPKQEPVQKIRDWGKHATWGRILVVLLLVSAVIIIAAARQLQWIAFLILAPGVLLLVSRDAMAALLKCLGSWLDGMWPKYAIDPVTRKEEKILVADPLDVHIQPEVSATRVHEATQLRVRFCKEQLNYAAALGDITPIWDFGHDDLTPEEGWEVVHYFPRPRRYIVRVMFQRRLGGFLTYPHERHAAPPESHPTIVYVKKEIDAARSEFGVTLLAAGLNVVWLLVALVPALLALYTGAIDQLNKLDPIPALIAVFALGFTSDQVKNVLTQKPK